MICSLMILVFLGATETLLDSLSKKPAGVSESKASLRKYHKGPHQVVLLTEEILQNYVLLWLKSSNMYNA